jgi:hypothetical protein
MLQEMSDVGDKNRGHTMKKITDRVDDKADDLSGQAVENAQNAQAKAHELRTGPPISHRTSRSRQRAKRGR